MPESSVQRRLAAILAADVVGFSRLMGADEEGTLAALNAHRAELIDPSIATHRGRMVKTTGDGALVEFASAVDAVRCAVDIQQAMVARNADVPAERRIAFRIGINLGDIIIEGDDIYGDGVNLAARLEGLAEPGGVCVSRAVRDQVRGKLPVTLEDWGEREVKNFARPVRVFNVTWTAAAPAAPAVPTSAASAPEPAPAKPSIAVLAFNNMSGDAEQEYFSDGISEDVITDLSKISALTVIARNSSFVYKGKSVSVQQVGRELGVRYVLEGSVRKAANRVRVNAQLIDGDTGAHVWAERYDRDLTDIFEVQDELTKEIVEALALKLTRDDADRLERHGTTNVEAYELFLRGREQVWLTTREGVERAKSLLSEAVRIDPSFSTACAMLGFIGHVEYVNEWSDDPEASLRNGIALCEKAVALDDQDPFAHMALGDALLWARAHDRSLRETECAVALDPNFAMGHVSLGVAYLYDGRYRDALDCYARAQRLDPMFSDVILHFMGQAHLHLGDYAKAERLARERIARNPQTDASRVLLAAALGYQGRTDEARAAWDELMRVNPRYSFAQRRRVLPYRDPAAIELVAQGLAKSGIEV